MRAGKLSLLPRIAFLGQIRRSLRRNFFAFLDRILQTDDARALLADRLQGVFEAASVSMPHLLETPYPGLGNASEETFALGRTDAVFITARFRSGSTLLWNLFRHVPGVTAYYEPLNERRWFDPATRGKRVDPTHRQVSDYWKEYEGLEDLGGYYREDWIRRDLVMGPRFRDDNLRRFLEILIREASGRPVLQFNRVDFRLPWLRRNFPAARIVHLYRHPRDQWLSSLIGAKDFPRDGSLADFAGHDGYYLREWGRDLSYHFPFLDERRIEHPYALFYYIWKLSFAYGRRYADYSLAYEDLLAEPDAELRRLFAFLGMADFDLPSLTGLVERAKPGKWRRYADDAWFRRHEAACDAVLADFFETEITGRDGALLAACPR